MNGNIRPADMKRINTPELAEAFIAEQVAQVRAQVEERPQGFDVRLFMDDDQGSLFSLTLLSPTREDAQGIADRFLAHPDRVYNSLLGALLADDDGREHR